MAFIKVNCNIHKVSLVWSTLSSYPFICFNLSNPWLKKVPLFLRGGASLDTGRVSWGVPLHIGEILDNYYQ